MQRLVEVAAARRVDRDQRQVGRVVRRQRRAPRPRAPPRPAPRPGTPPAPPARPAPRRTAAAPVPSAAAWHDAPSSIPSGHLSRCRTSPGTAGPPPVAGHRQAVHRTPTVQREARGRSRRRRARRCRPPARPPAGRRPRRARPATPAPGTSVATSPTVAGGCGQAARGRHARPRGTRPLRRRPARPAAARPARPTVSSASQRVHAGLLHLVARDPAGRRRLPHQAQSGRSGPAVAQRAEQPLGVPLGPVEQVAGRRRPLRDVGRRAGAGPAQPLAAQDRCTSPRWASRSRPVQSGQPGTRSSSAPASADRNAALRPAISSSIWSNDRVEVMRQSYTPPPTRLRRSRERPVRGHSTSAPEPVPISRWARETRSPSRAAAEQTPPHAEDRAAGRRARRPRGRAPGGATWSPSRPRSPARTAWSVLLQGWTKTADQILPEATGGRRIFRRHRMQEAAEPRGEPPRAGAELAVRRQDSPDRRRLSRRGRPSLSGGRSPRRAAGRTAQPVFLGRRHEPAQVPLESLHPRPRGGPQVPPCGSALGAQRVRYLFMRQPDRFGNRAGKPRVPDLPGSPASNSHHDQRHDSAGDQQAEQPPHPRRGRGGRHGGRRWGRGRRGRRRRRWAGRSRHGLARPGRRGLRRRGRARGRRGRRRSGRRRRVRRRGCGRRPRRQRGRGPRRPRGGRLWHRGPRRHGSRLRRQHSAGPRGRDRAAAAPAGGEGEDERPCCQHNPKQAGHAADVNSPSLGPAASDVLEDRRAA